MSTSLSLQDESFSKYEPCRMFTATNNILDTDRSVLLSPVNSIDIEPIEATLALASHGRKNALTLFNLDVGVVIQRFNRVASDGGIRLVKFSRRVAESSCLVVPNVSPSDTLSYAIRTYSLLQSSTLRTFPGHAQQICSLAQSKADDSFVSADVSGEVRLWDARLALSCVGRLRLPSLQQETGGVNDEAFVAYHPDGLSFAVLQRSSGVVRLFTLTNLDKGPFKILTVPPEVRFARPPLVAGARPESPSYVDIRFSLNGKILIVTTDQNILFSLEVDSGRLVYQCDIASTRTCPATPDFSADGNYLAVSGPAGPLVFRSTDGRLVTTLDAGANCSTSQICCFSPRTEMLISSGEDATIFWCQRDDN